MELKIIQHLSEDYVQMVKLRTDVLLEPSGIPASYIQPQNEDQDIHIGAFDASKILGCCVLTPRGAHLVHLRQMAVAPEAQGKGTGAAIVKFAEGITRQKGFATLYLHARDPVIPFYQKLGYAIAGPEFLEVGIAHHRMEKTL